MDKTTLESLGDMWEIMNASSINYMCMLMLNQYIKI